MSDDIRAEAEQHIADHALGEAERIGRLSRIREFVLGAQDGLLVPLGVVTGMAAAHPARSLIIVAGLAEAVAGAISMGGGSYLASEAEEQLYASEIAAERREIEEFPERETAELALILEREGLPREQAASVATSLASNPNVFLRTKVEKELGLSPDAGGAAMGRRARGRLHLPRGGGRAALALLLLLVARRPRGEPRLHARGADRASASRRASSRGSRSSARGSRSRSSGRSAPASAMRSAIS